MKNGKAFEIDLDVREGSVTIILSKEVLFDASKALCQAKPGRTDAFRACHALGKLVDASREILYGHAKLADLPLLEKALTNEDGTLRIYDGETAE